MFSTTTMALSTSMPMPRVSPAREMTFRLMPVRYMKPKVVKTEMGMAMAMVRVLYQVAQKKPDHQDGEQSPQQGRRPAGGAGPSG